MVEYLGTNPGRMSMDIDVATAAKVASILSSTPSPTQAAKMLREAGIPVVIRPGSISLIYNPPSGCILSASNDFGEDIIELRPETVCGECGSELRVRKTVTRQVKTPSGIRKVREHVCACPVHRKLVRREPRLTPPRSTHTFELIAEVGMLRYLQHKQISEICSAMKMRGLNMPPRSAGWLCRRFLEYFIAVHIGSAPAIRALLERRGGYALILDGTVDMLTFRHGTKETRGSPPVQTIEASWHGFGYFCRTGCVQDKHNGNGNGLDGQHTETGEAEFIG